MFELRTYTLSSPETLEQYATIHWQRHIDSLATHGVTTHHVWKRVDGDLHQLVALVEYAAGADPRAVTETYMGSTEFRADMDGFPMDAIQGVSSVFVEPASSDPTV